MVESGLEGLLPDALLTGLRDALEGNAPAVPVDVIHRALRTVYKRADEVRQERQQHLADNADKEGVTLIKSGCNLKS